MHVLSLLYNSVISSNNDPWIMYLDDNVNLKSVIVCWVDGRCGNAFTVCYGYHIPIVLGGDNYDVD